MTTVQRFVALLALTASFAVAAAPASAWTSNLNAHGSYVLVPPAPSSAASPGSNGQPVIIRVTGHSSFAWGEVGIGAAGAIALLAILTGVALAVHHRGRRTATPRI
jgi:hypothetical protein